MALPSPPELLELLADDEVVHSDSTLCCTSPQMSSPQELLELAAAGGDPERCPRLTQEACASLLEMKKVGRRD